MGLSAGDFFFFFFFFSFFSFNSEWLEVYNGKLIHWEKDSFGAGVPLLLFSSPFPFFFSFSLFSFFLTVFAEAV